MGIILVSVKCPNCGASLDIDSSREQAFCSYCGTKILLHNENEYVYRHIDDAGIKQAETDQIVQLKKMEIAEKKRVANEKKFKIKIIISLASAAIGILMMVVGWMAGSASGDPNSGFYMLSLVGMFPLLGAAYIWLHSKKDEEDDDYGEKVKVPSGIMDYEKKSYHAIEAVFKSAGFTNVQCVPLNDLSVGLLKRPEMVESITIHGEKVTSGGDKYMPNASVVISYHSYPGRK